MPGRAAQAQPVSRPGQRLQYARPCSDCTRKVAQQLSRMCVCHKDALRKVGRTSCFDSTGTHQVDNAQVGSLAADGCTVHGQILRPLAPTAHGLSKVNAHQLRKVHGRRLKVAVYR
jgi:hypothetical protein